MALNFNLRPLQFGGVLGALNTSAQINFQKQQEKAQKRNQRTEVLSTAVGIAATIYGGPLAGVAAREGAKVLLGGRTNPAQVSSDVFQGLAFNERQGALDKQEQQKGALLAALNPPPETIETDTGEEVPGPSTRQVPGRANRQEVLGALGALDPKAAAQSFLRGEAAATERGFKAGETEKGREFKAGQSEIGRRFKKAESKKDRQLKRELADETEALKRELQNKKLLGKGESTDRLLSRLMTQNILAEQGNAQPLTDAQADAVEKLLNLNAKSILLGQATGIGFTPFRKGEDGPAAKFTAGQKTSKLANAKAAISAGADSEQVKERLRKQGFTDAELKGL